LVFVSHYKIVLASNENGIIDPKAVSEKLGLSISTVKKYIKNLENEGLIIYKDGVFKLTNKGEALKKSLLKLRNKAEQGISPYLVTEPDTGVLIPLSIKNYEQLYVVIKYGLAPRNILEEHFRRGYLAKWIKEVLGDEYFAKLYSEGKIKTLDDLKNYIKNMIKLIK